MFARLAKRAAQPVSALRGTKNCNNNILRNPSLGLNAIRHQSSSSSSRDNDNSNNSEVEPISPNEKPVNASFELQQVDLAHGSFFALHRPLLGITNGPMFASNNGLFNDDDPEDAVVEDLTNYFSTLHPFSIGSSSLSLPSLSSPVTATATAWASLPPTLTDADQAADEFLRMMQDKHDRMSYFEQLELAQKAEAEEAAARLFRRMNTPSSKNKTQKTDQHRHQHQSMTANEQKESETKKAPSKIQIFCYDDNYSIRSVATVEAEAILDPLLNNENGMYLTSVLRKRRIKMRKHKYKKLRKRTRALRKKLGK
ncbi:hypothetical protein BX616_002940 [Lobosporangium transversale]|uniref:Small ribosomal subunit protein mS38 n=1 Tax=Lobosporangium transversale TaxID=64571 RepID=A0A1Y2G186_9FUNG|nr:hypothetical protein BCR41DRAFT_365875 [Lobosporangium transversale]KAF9899597.1 hypothetical protein BX616_002940 [Lobosporangium transversale]ORY90605.1 hypothetical protein BCR41DRAFT_365875 [Lobosporangium transversale]|eukprot:XP_021875100.1 hypothetical protein BCR41DRAFT_365875 [Lobosporangium transversale]